jgi:hypothetical protein
VDRRQPQFAPHSRSQTHFGSEQDVFFAYETTLGTKTNENISHRSVSDYASDAQDVVEVIGRLLALASQRRRWLRDLTSLREQIRQDGGLQVGTTKEEVVERLRQTRRDIFETQYAHLYR